MGEREDLGGFGMDTRLVLEAGGQAQRARLEFACEHLDHLRHFFPGCDAPEVVAHDLPAQSIVADVGRDIHRRRRRLHLGEEFGKRILRTAVLADHSGRDALADVIQCIGIFADCAVGVAVGIDESR